MNHFLITIVVGSIGVLMSTVASSEERAAETPAGTLERPPNLEFATWGGKQFWSDQLVFRGWRIQRHAVSGHCRLLDDGDVRRAWGSFEQCRTEFERQRNARAIPPLEGEVVVLLHGLVRSRNSMSQLAEFLQAESDYEVVNVSYASTRSDINAHARSLASVIRHLGPVDRIHFVAHSMGNLVIRRYLATIDPASPRPPFGRVVMLAPPNNGSQLAHEFRDNPLFRLVWGASGLEIANWGELEQQLATPDDFGILAGGSGADDGGNPLIPGDDDFVVTVAETRLAGARDFRVVRANHGSILDDPRVHGHTRTFLQHGYFVAEDRREPIPVDPIPRAVAPASPLRATPLPAGPLPASPPPASPEP